jgi:hypothetical protein
MTLNTVINHLSRGSEHTRDSFRCGTEFISTEGNVPGIDSLYLAVAQINQKRQVKDLL